MRFRKNEHGCMGGTSGHEVTSDHEETIDLFDHHSFGLGKDKAVHVATVGCFCACVCVCV